MRVRVVQQLEVADAERALAERGPFEVRRRPPRVRVLAVAAVAEVHVDGAAGIDVVVVDAPRVRALVGVDVPREDDVDAVLVEERLVGPAHELGLVVVRAVAVVEGRVHHDDDPGRARPVHFFQVFCEPRPLEPVAVLEEIVVGVERDDVRGPRVDGPVQGRRAPRGRVGRRPARLEVDPLLAGADLVVAARRERRHAAEDAARQPAEGVPAEGPAVGVGQVAADEDEVRVQRVQH